MVVDPFYWVYFSGCFWFLQDSALLSEGRVEIPSHSQEPVSAKPLNPDGMVPPTPDDMSGHQHVTPHSPCRSASFVHFLSKVLALTNGIVAALLKCCEGWIRVFTKTYPGQPGIGAWPVTIVAAIGGAFAWAIVFPSILEQVLTIMIKSSSIGGAEGKKVAEKMEAMHSIMKMQRPISVLSFSMIIGMKIFEDPFIQQYFVVAYFLGCSVISFFFVFVVGLPAIVAFEQTIRESMGDNPNPKMKALHDKVCMFLRELRNNGYSNTASAIIFGVCPFLWSVAPYQNAFGWTMGIVIYTVGILFMAPSSGKPAKVAASSTTISTTVSSNSSEDDDK